MDSADLVIADKQITKGKVQSLLYSPEKKARVLPQRPKLKTIFEDEWT